MKILHLTLKKKWFDMIASGEKKEEYREWKPYWAERLLERGMKDCCAVYAGDTSKWKSFDIIRFKNGYSSSAPEMDIQCNGITLGSGKYEWGGRCNQIVIKLGKILSIKNYTSLTEKA